MAMCKTLRTRALRPAFEALEERIALSITIEFDYSRDTSGFFSANPITQTLLQQAGQALGQSKTANWRRSRRIRAQAIPGPSRRHSPVISSIQAWRPGTILVEVVGTAIDPSGFAGEEAGHLGYSAGELPTPWLNLVETQGGSSDRLRRSWEVASNSTRPKAGSRRTRTARPYSTNPSLPADSPPPTGRTRGSGTSQAWTGFVDTTNNTFTGPNA